MSEKNNPLEGLMDLINQYTKEDASKLDLETVKEKVSSLLNEDYLKGLLGSQGKSSLDALGSLGNLGAMANMMNILPMVEKVVNQRSEQNKIKKCTCHKKNGGCYKDNWEHWY